LVGWLGMTTCVQLRQCAVTMTLVPYSACVSSLPTSQLFCAVVRPLIHMPGSAGLPSDSLSTARGYHGWTHAVATLTATQHVPDTHGAGVTAAPAAGRVMTPGPLAVPHAAAKESEPAAAAMKAVRVSAGR